MLGHGEGTIEFPHTIYPSSKKVFISNTKAGTGRSVFQAQEKIIATIGLWLHVAPN